MSYSCIHEHRFLDNHLSMVVGSCFWQAAVTSIFNGFAGDSIGTICLHTCVCTLVVNLTGSKQRSMFVLFFLPVRICIAPYLIQGIITSIISCPWATRFFLKEFQRVWGHGCPFPPWSLGFGAMNLYFPYEFIGLGAMGGLKHSTNLWASPVSS